MAYRVIADIEYLDGSLAGVRIPAGYSVTCATRSQVESVTRWLAKVRDTNDFIRAAVTGNRYRVFGSIDVEAGA